MIDTKIVERLTGLVEASLVEDVLDEVVHDAASQIGSNVNNAGPAAQVQFLLDNGWSSEQIEAWLEMVGDDEDDEDDEDEPEERMPKDMKEMREKIDRLGLQNRGSLITIGEGPDCLGHLMWFDGRGAYEATAGLVNVSEDDVKAHNKALDQAMLDGLDNNCEIGQHGTFYLQEPKDGRRTITTFTSLLVSDDVTRNGDVVTFLRNGKTFRGRASNEHAMFNFRRVL